MEDDFPMTVLNEPLLSIVEARHHDPFAVLGRHPQGSTTVVRAFLPEAERVWIGGVDRKLPMERIPGSDLFQWRGATAQVSERYLLHWEDRQGHPHSRYDPYSFPPLIGEYDLYLYGEGKHRRPHHFLGANPATQDGIAGVLFAVWAPNAVRVSVVGDFNRWDGRRHPMRARGGSGVWELFIPGLAAGTLYKFEMRSVTARFGKSRSVRTPVSKCAAKPRWLKSPQPSHMSGAMPNGWQRAGARLAACAAVDL